jgi:hypothetical protein
MSVLARWAAKYNLKLSVIQKDTARVHQTLGAPAKQRIRAS